MAGVVYAIFGAIMTGLSLLLYPIQLIGMLTGLW